jgi:YHS domain-containing protein
MTQVKDPVCGMMIDADTAAGRSDFKGRTYYFCSAACLRRFDADPAKFVGAPASADAPAVRPNTELERHEPPYTKFGGMIAPKFGSAGSGGLEYERLPEAHDRRDAR